MEFMKIKNLDVNLNYKEFFPFNELRNFPEILVDEHLKLISSEYNTNSMRYYEKLKSCLVKIRKVTKNISRDVDDFPTRILLEVTTACNLECQMCPREIITRNKSEHLSLEVCKRVILEADSYGIEGLWLYHIGEPFLHPQFTQILEYASTLNKLGQKWLSTNGYYLNDNNINAILNSKLDYLNISINAFSGETHKNVVKKDGFDLVLKQYTKLIEEKRKRGVTKPFIRVQLVEQEATKHEVDAFINRHYLDADIVSINMLEHLTVSGNDFGEHQRKRGKRGHCKRISRGDCIVCSNGVIIPCDEACDGTEDIIGKLYLGNIHENSLHEVWKNTNREHLLYLESHGRMEQLALCKTCLDYDF